MAGFEYIKKYRKELKTLRILKRYEDLEEIWRKIYYNWYLKGDYKYEAKFRKNSEEFSWRLWKIFDTEIIKNTKILKIRKKKKIDGAKTILLIRNKTIEVVLIRIAYLKIIHFTINWKNWKDK